MKKIINLTFLILLSFSSYSQFGTNTGIGYDWSDLNTDEQELLEKRAMFYINLLKEKNVDEFYSACHPKFKEFLPKVSFTEIGGLLADNVATSEKTQRTLGKKVVFNSAPTNAQLAIGGSLDQTQSDYLQFIAVAGIKEQAILVYDLGGSPLQKAIIIKLGLDKNKFKLIAIDMATTSFNGKNADHYWSLSEEWNQPNQKVNKYLALTMAYRLSYLGQGNVGSMGSKVTAEFQKMQIDTAFVKSVRNWKVDDRNVSVINYDFIETRNDLTPNIMYISEEKLVEKSITKEAQRLYQHLSKDVSNFASEFPVVMFQAYEEYPALKTKQYNYYRAITKNKK